MGYELVLIGSDNFMLANSAKYVIYLYSAYIVWGSLRCN